jgi:hypothetical protein
MDVDAILYLRRPFSVFLALHEDLPVFLFTVYFEIV